MNEKEMESLLAAAPITEHVAGFSSEQMVACPSCSRKNAPKRLKCIYCGAILEGAYFADVPLSHTQLEAWQKGWNVIIRPTGVELDDSILSKMVDEFSLEKGFLMNVISSSTPLPLACVGTEEEATIWSRRLKNYGLRSDVIADDALIQVRLRRIREIRFRDTVLELVDF